MSEYNYSPGLEGVIAGETAISEVDGDAGRLYYRGYPVEELVQKRYLEVMLLVLEGTLPTETEIADLAAFLAVHGALDDAELASVKACRHVHPMQAVQALLPMLCYRDDRLGDFDVETTCGLQMIAKMPTLIAALYCEESGRAAPGMDSSAGYLQNFLTMFTGDNPSPRFVDVLKVVQVLQMEHSFNAGTFATRVVGSTLAPIEAVFSAGIGTLAGILHGGADEAALVDARRVGSPDNAAAWIDALLARKGKLMGMGHREYRVVDPRSALLKPIAKSLCMGTAAENTYLTLEAMETAFAERMAERGKPVKANLEFYKGAVYEVLGIPPHYFTAVFAMSRMVGWLAHFMEQRANNRIYRPRAIYTGRQAA